MKRIILLLFAVFLILIACNSTQDKKSFDNNPKLENDTVRISNKKIDYEVIIIDPAFTNWFNSYAKPRSYYSQSYLEARNIVWVTEWNRRFLLPNQYNRDLYEMPINYSQGVDYGFEVNYMIYNYLVFFQLNYKQKLGGYTPRI